MVELVGKINTDFFKKNIHQQCGFNRKEVIKSAALGVDVSVIQISDQKALISASDPLTLIPSLGMEESAWLSVHLTANDIATTGFAPQFAQMVLNLPATITTSDFELYWKYIHQFSKEIQMQITGGHTGFIEGQNSTIAGGATLFSIVPKNEVLTSDGVQEKDVILMTKNCAMTATAILAKSFPQTVKNKAGNEIYQKAESRFYQTSVLKESLLACEIGRHSYGVTAMHDVTEGGIIGALSEMLTASNKGAIIFNEMLPKDEVNTELEKIFSIDTRFCVGAGSMIITCKEIYANSIIEKLKENEIPCVQIGITTSMENGIKIIENDRESELVAPKSDPYWEAYFNALKNNWK